VTEKMNCRLGSGCAVDVALLAVAYLLGGIGSVNI